MRAAAPAVVAAVKTSVVCVETFVAAAVPVTHPTATLGKKSLAGLRR